MKQVWKPLNNPRLSLLNAISDLIVQQENNFPQLLTSVRNGPTLFMSADFGGQHKDSKYDAYCFLLADFIYLWLWNDLRKSIRDLHLKDRRRIAFKKLSDYRRQNALSPFLDAANYIPGLCAILLIDKRIHSIIEKCGPLDMTTSEYDNYRHWKPHVFEKLLRIAHFSAMIIACMSAPKQNLLYFIDEDEIAPNDKRLAETCHIFTHIMNHYLPHGMGHFRLGTTKSDDESLTIEDLTAIPDLVAGAFCELAPGLSYSHDLDNGFKIYPSSISEKSRIILDWFTQDIYTLKRIVISIDLNNSNEIIPRCTKFLHFKHL